MNELTYSDAKVDISDFNDGEIFCITEISQDGEEGAEIWMDRKCIMGIFKSLEKMLGEKICPE